MTHDRIMNVIKCSSCGEDHVGLRATEKEDGTYLMVCPTKGRALLAENVSPVSHPPHYCSHPSGVECITITECYSFNVGNAIKYLWRADEKGRPIEDLRKAAWYVNREIERRKRNGNAKEEAPDPAPRPAAEDVDR